MNIKKEKSTKKPFKGKVNKQMQIRKANDKKSKGGRLSKKGETMKKKK